VRTQVRREILDLLFAANLVHLIYTPGEILMGGRGVYPLSRGSNLGEERMEVDKK